MTVLPSLVFGSGNLRGLLPTNGYNITDDHWAFHPTFGYEVGKFLAKKKCLDVNVNDFLHHHERDHFTAEHVFPFEKLDLSVMNRFGKGDAANAYLNLTDKKQYDALALLFDNQTILKDGRWEVGWKIQLNWKDYQFFMAVICQFREADADGKGTLDKREIDNLIKESGLELFPGDYEALGNPVTFVKFFVAMKKEFDVWQLFKKAAWWKSPVDGSYQLPHRGDGIGGVVVGLIQRNTVFAGKWVYHTAVENVFKNPDVLEEVERNEAGRKLPNRSGTMTFKQFRFFMRALEKFNEFDADDSGSIDKQEMGALLQWMGSAGMTEAYNFASFGDTIELNEFVLFLANPKKYVEEDTAAQAQQKACSRRRK